MTTTCEMGSCGASLGETLSVVEECEVEEDPSPEEEQEEEDEDVSLTDPDTSPEASTLMNASSTPADESTYL